MRTSDMVKSKFFRARDVEGVAPFILKIADVTEELMGRPGGRQDVKCFLWFMESPKGLQLNKTRVNILEAAYGPDSTEWVGKRVKLFFDPTVEFGGRAVGGVGIATPPGIVYNRAGGAAAASWGAPAAPPGAPPPPVWDDKRQMWIMPPPPVATAAQAPPRQPPPPVFNPATGQWEMVNPGTGEIAPILGNAQRTPERPANAQPTPSGHDRPLTIQERVNAAHPPMQVGGDEWGQPAAAGGHAPDFDDDIPF